MFFASTVMLHTEAGQPCCTLVPYNAHWQDPSFILCVYTLWSTKRYIFFTLSIATAPLHPLSERFLVPVSLWPLFPKNCSQLWQAWARTNQHVSASALLVFFRRAVTVWFWHNNLMEVLMACLKVQFMDWGAVLFTTSTCTLIQKDMEIKSNK